MTFTSQSRRCVTNIRMRRSLLLLLLMFAFVVTPPQINNAQTECRTASTLEACQILDCNNSQVIFNGRDAFNNAVWTIILVLHPNHDMSCLNFPFVVCNNDKFAHKTSASSSNVFDVVGNGVENCNSIFTFKTPPNQVLPWTFGFKVRFQQNYNVDGTVRPRRAVLQISPATGGIVPQSETGVSFSVVKLPDDGED